MASRISSMAVAKMIDKVKTRTDTLPKLANLTIRTTSSPTSSSFCVSLPSPASRSLVLLSASRSDPVLVPNFFFCISPSPLLFGLTDVSIGRQQQHVSSSSSNPESSEDKAL
jgi:hypothetical protein